MSTTTARSTTLDRHCETVGPLPARDRALTRSERRYLEALDRLRTPQHPAHVFSLPNGRWGLLARTATSPYDFRPGLNKNDATLRVLEAAGLIRIGRGTSLPVPFEQGYGHPIELTTLGVDTITAPPIGAAS